jgi:hypothetical protein
MKKFLLWLLGLLVLVSLLYVLIIMFYTYSDGERAGTLYKFSHKGYVFKTYEGELNIGGVNQMIINDKSIWTFSVATDSIAKKLISAEGKYVRLHYDEKLRTLPWRGESKYIVDQIIDVK